VAVVEVSLGSCRLYVLMIWIKQLVVRAPSFHHLMLSLNWCNHHDCNASVYLFIKPKCHLTVLQGLLMLIKYMGSL